MRESFFFKLVLIILLTCVMVTVSGCQTGKVKEYYSQKTNYITAAGTVSHISCDAENRSLYIGFSSLTPSFDDSSFKIVGKNFDVVYGKGITDFLEMGSQAEFITAPMYFGDGYVMPIVSISIEGETFLGFEEGFQNFVEWLNE